MQAATAEALSGIPMPVDMIANNQDDQPENQISEDNLVGRSNTAAIVPLSNNKDTVPRPVQPWSTRDDPVIFRVRVCRLLAPRIWAQQIHRVPPSPSLLSTSTHRMTC